MLFFEGAGVALVTPFKENGTVNYEVLESLIEEQIAAGTDCIVAMGTTGESATTSEEEHIQVIRFVCEVVTERIPVGLPEQVPTAHRQQLSFLLRPKRQEQTAFS